MIRRRLADFILTTAAVMLAIWLWSCGPLIDPTDPLGPLWLITGGIVAGYLLAIRNMKSTVRRAERGERIAQWTLDLLFGEQPQQARQAARKHHNDNRRERAATRRKPTTRKVIRKAS